MDRLDKRIPLAAGAIVILLLIVILLARNLTSRDDASVTSTVTRLRALEARDVNALSGQANTYTASAASPDQEAASALSSANAVSSETPSPASLTASQEESLKTAILNGYVLSNVDIRQKFRNTAIIGDSIAESIWEFGYLETDVVITHRGLSIIDADEQIETAIAMSPSVVFMAFGANDLLMFESDVDTYGNTYRALLQQLKNSIPGVTIYVNGILPILDSAIADAPALAYYPQYNERLRTICQEMGITFIDNTFIVEADPSLYEPDAIHVVNAYYPMWLTHMAGNALFMPPEDYENYS